MKYTEGFTRLWPAVGTVLAMVISLGLLSVGLIIAGIVGLKLATPG